MAQEPGEWEVGGSVGYGWYRNGSIYGPGETIQAGIRNRFAAGAVVGEDLYNYVSGEVRWLYQDGHPFIQGPGFRTDIQGNSNTFTYDTLAYFRPKERRIRPFVAAGAGAKDYVIAGPAPLVQPVPTIATLATHDQWKFVADVGGGVKFLVHTHVLMRVDFRDYMTSFPRSQIVPAAGNTARGILQQFTVLLGVSGWF
ncbi:MAG TPA: hypothetical protein VMA31_01400 [Bryobacteraceae bacterium]|nr:hypothetical protein [Bryobacteraceae bacterium]